MPYKTRAATNEYQRVYKRTQREKAKQEKAQATATACETETHDDPAQALADWSRQRLVVPPGHVNAGQALGLASIRRVVHS